MPNNLYIPDPTMSFPPAMPLLALTLPGLPLCVKNLYLILNSKVSGALGRLSCLTKFGQIPFLLFGTHIWNSLGVHRSGIEPGSPALQVNSLPMSHQEVLMYYCNIMRNISLMFFPGSLHRVSKILGIFRMVWMRGESLAVHNKPFQSYLRN